MGAEINVESQVDLILQYLANSFNQFRVNDSMNKKAYILSELMNELIVAEGILKAKAIVHMAQASSSKLKGG